MNLFVLVPLICFVAYSILAAMVLRHPNRVRALFAVYLLAAALWSIGSSLAHTDILPGYSTFWMQIVAVAGIGMMIAYYHFVLVFVKKSPNIWVILGYALLIAFAVLTTKGYTLRGAYLVEGNLYFDWGISIYLISLLGTVYALLAVFLLVQNYRRAVDPLVRRRTGYLLLGLAVFAPFGLTRLMPPLIEYPIDYVGALVHAMIISYAILRYQLFDIKLIVGRGLVYTSLTVFATVAYLLTLFILHWFFQIWIGYSSLAFAAGFAFLIALFFNPLRNALQKVIDRLLYRETYDYRQMLLSFSDKINKVLDVDELAQSILDPVIENLRATQAALLFPEAESGDFGAQFVQTVTPGEKTIAKLRFRADNPIVVWLAKGSKAFRSQLMDFFPQFKGLWQAEKDDFEALEIELLCPIRSRDSLIGILALGRKQSGSPYTDEEVDLLMTMTNEAALALERARILQDLKVQQRRVEQLLERTVAAEEDERKRISFELHDSVAQWLVGASYRLQLTKALLPNSDSDRLSQELAEVESTIDRSVKELRRIVAGLRPITLDELGLIPALDEALKSLKAEGIVCHLTSAGRLVRLPPSVELSIYRIILEALNNVRKHANATTVDLKLDFHRNDLLVEIHDNGKGFNLSETLNSALSVGHMGLLGMKQRTEIVGGTLEIKTGRRIGTSVLLRLPLQSQT